MIIVKLEGGHSNQLFQYAAGRRLADKLGVELFMDKWWFENVVDLDSPRFYELGEYKLKQKFISRKDFALVENKPDNLRAKIYTLTKGKNKPRIKNYRYTLHDFDKKFLAQPDNTYLDGWWQNERYFKKIRPTLLEEVELKTGATGKNAQWLKQIKETNSVSIHIRRGDYVTNKQTNKIHGVTSLDYYNRALDTLAKKSGKKEFTLFIFSNDMPWCQKNLKFKYPTIFVDGKNSGPEDMRLMKNCQHNIMANSTFSWWGAWLNQNPNKIIIAPKAWFNDKVENSQVDILPSEWIRL